MSVADNDGSPHEVDTDNNHENCDHDDCCSETKLLRAIPNQSHGKPVVFRSLQLLSSLFDNNSNSSIKDIADLAVSLEGAKHVVPPLLEACASSMTWKFLCTNAPNLLK